MLSAGLLDEIIDSWPRAGLSEHLRLEISYAYSSGHQPREMPSVEILLENLGELEPEERWETLGCLVDDSALGADEPVPGCGCESCTGIAQDHPARARPRPHGRSRDRETRVEAARAVPLLKVAQRLGIAARKAGKGYMACCPFHKDETPSLSLNPQKGLWHCFSCDRGGDGIQLLMDLRKLTFVEAVKELAP